MDPVYNGDLVIMDQVCRSQWWTVDIMDYFSNPLEVCIMRFYCSALIFDHHVLGIFFEFTYNIWKFYFEFIHPKLFMKCHSPNVKSKFNVEIQFL